MRSVRSVTGWEKLATRCFFTLKIFAAAAMDLDLMDPQTHGKSSNRESITPILRPSVAAKEKKWRECKWI